MADATAVRRETSGKTTRAILMYLKKQGREDVYPDIVARFGVPIADLLDEYNWFSYQLKVDLLRYAKEVLGDPMMPFEMGRIIATLDASRAELLLVRALLSPENAFRRVAQNAPHFTRAGEMECREVDKGRVVIAYRVTGDVRPALEDCQYAHGVLAGVPDVFGSGPARSRQLECQLEGAPWCVFEVTYPGRATLWGHTADERKWLEEAVRELEGKHRLLEETQFRLQQRTADLQRQVEAQMADLEAANRKLTAMNAFKDQLLSSLSHDLRSALSGIQGLSEALHTGAIGDDDGKRRAQALILRSAEQCMMITDDLLDFTQLQTGQVSFRSERCAFGPVVEGAIAALAPVAESKQVRIRAHIPEDLPMLSLDRPKMLRAVSNVLSNAIKFAPAGSEIEVRLTRRGEVQRLEVIDAGPGVAAGERDRIFEPFVRGGAASRTAADGVGLGLHIVRQIMDAHCGEVGVDDAGDGRTCFTIELPERRRRPA